MSTSFRDLWDAQWRDDDSEFSKEAAALGLNEEEYLEKLAEKKVEQDEQQKVAEQNEYACGQIIGGGIKQGVSSFFSKLAASGGNAHASQAIKNLFCSE